MLKNAGRIVDVRRTRAERRLRNLRESYTATLRRIDQLEQQQGNLEKQLLTASPIPNSTLSIDTLATIADQARILRLDIAAHKHQHEELQETLRKIEKSCRLEVQTVLAMKHRSSFLEDRDKRETRRRQRTLEAL